MLANDVSFIPHIKRNKEKLEKDARKGQKKKKKIHLGAEEKGW